MLLLMPILARQPKQRKEEQKKTKSRRLSRSGRGVVCDGSKRERRMSMLMSSRQERSEGWGAVTMTGSVVVYTCESIPNSYV